MTTMRAKMVVTGVGPQDEQGNETLLMSAVGQDAAYPIDGTSEDNTYARFTPMGRLELTVNNPALRGQFKPGQKFFVDFSQVVGLMVLLGTLLVAGCTPFTTTTGDAPGAPVTITRPSIPVPAVPSVPILLSGTTVALPASGVLAEAGEWTADWSAAIALAQQTAKPYIILIGRSAGCEYCNVAEVMIWSQPAFKEWAKSNGIALVNADYVHPTVAPVPQVLSTYSGIQYFPTILVIDGAGTGKRLLGSFVCRKNNLVNGVKLDMSPAGFAAAIQSYCQTCSVPAK